MRIHEDDPRVKTRPPRVPKSSPIPIVDSSNTRPLTTNEQRAQSVSEKPPSKIPASQEPTSASVRNMHFLSEFNVDDCFDFRAIPDPPSPKAASRNRRRLSTPVPPTTVNQASHATPPHKNSSSGMPLADDESFPRASGKRSRNSLCHVPSPIVASTEQHDDPSLPDSPPPVACNNMHVSICLDEDDHQDNTANSVKRRKKRQSMELPRELVLENAARSVEASFAPPRASIPTRPSSCQSHQNLPIAFQGDMQNMEDLQQLVRGYCKVPRERRSTCQQAITIEETTGYPLAKQDVVTDSPQRMSSRRMLLQTMAPIIEEIDKRKAEDIAKWEYETACRVERSTKSGKYRYISIETNTKVGSQEYKRRYMGVLEREASWRLAKTNEWKAKLDATATKAGLEEVDLNKTEGEETSSMDVQLVTDSSSDVEECESTSFDTTDGLDLDPDEIIALEAKTSEEIAQESLPSGFTEQEEVSCMEICDMSVSLDLGDAPFDVPVEFETSSRMKTDNTPTVEDSDEEEELRQVLAPITTRTDHDGCALNEESEKVVPKSVTPTDMSELLPLPDRGEKSMDPDIAKAERRLWRRIDDALRDYSHEVMEIMNSRSTDSN